MKGYIGVLTFGNVTRSYYSKKHLIVLLAELEIKIFLALQYQLPRTTLKQHLRDCFGWLTC